MPPTKYCDKREPEPIDVVTNFFPLKVTKSADITVYQYEVRILSVWKEFTKNDEDKKIDRRKYTLIPTEDTDLFQDRNGNVRDNASDLTRRVMKECRDVIQRDHDKFIVSF